MSRKTKQQKIIADLRRQLAANREMKLEVTRLPARQGSEKMEIKESHLSFPNPSSHLTPPASVAYIKKDLTKTSILTILAVSLELVLYFLSRAGKF